MALATCRIEDDDPPAPPRHPAGRTPLGVAPVSRRAGGPVAGVPVDGSSGDDPRDGDDDLDAGDAADLDDAGEDLSGVEELADDAAAPVPSEAWLRGQDFVADCIAGVGGTRERFVREYGALVRYAVARVLRAKEPALLASDLDDVVQAVLLSFFDRDCRRLKMYEGRNQASFATFVRICATRQALDHLRTLRRRPRIAAEDPRDERDEGRLADAVEPGPGPEEQAQVAQRLDRLRAAVASLSPRERLVVRLAFVEGRDAPEVASVLGVSDNAVHVLKSRVKSKLKELVGPETLDDE